MYVIPYEADFECEKGHRFKAEASPMDDKAQHRCPVCLEGWISANVPNGNQVSPAVVKPPASVEL